MGASLAAAAVLAGDLGNLADRVRLRYVVDFVDLHLGNWHWYIFNVADAAISLGAAGLILADVVGRTPTAQAGDARRGCRGARASPGRLSRGPRTLRARPALFSRHLPGTWGRGASAQLSHLKTLDIRLPACYAEG